MLFSELWSTGWMVGEKIKEAHGNKGCLTLVCQNKLPLACGRCAELSHWQVIQLKHSVLLKGHFCNLVLANPSIRLKPEMTVNEAATIVGREGACVRKHGGSPRTPLPSSQ